jgi:hypothetical protein
MIVLAGDRWRLLTGLRSGHKFSQRSKALLWQAARTRLVEQVGWNGSLDLSKPLLGYGLPAFVQWLCGGAPTDHRADRSLSFYSVLSALMGEIDAALPAGMIAARNEQIAKAPAATLSANGSQIETPYSCAEINRPAPMASGRPRTRPSTTRPNAPRRTS